MIKCLCAVAQEKRSALIIIACIRFEVGRETELISRLLFFSPGSQLSSLECLDLSNNNLSVVPKGLPRNLVLLHLEKNSIRSIPQDALTSVRNLEYLLLHNNKLRSRSIHPTAFQVFN